MSEVKLKPKDRTITNTYTYKSIQCLCGKLIDVNFDEKLVDTTWCVDCNRYYTKNKNDEYISNEYKCFSCSGIYDKLYIGIYDLYSSGGSGGHDCICKTCLEKSINNRKELISKNQKELDVLIKRKLYKPKVED